LMAEISARCFALRSCFKRVPQNGRTTANRKVRLPPFWSHR
jgi:hypothetical protein